jgi:predicted NUDIX family phosphoesterase
MKNLHENHEAPSKTGLFHKKAPFFFWENCAKWIKTANVQNAKDKIPVASNESVLCIPRAQVPREWIQPKSVVRMDLDTFVDQCRQSGFSFEKRAIAEDNPAIKQVIPYIVLQTPDQTAVYNRQGSEKRLHDLWSLGIGGHINPGDQKSNTASFKDILLSGMERELSEELIHRPENDPAQFLGIISEDLTDVGKVHLGAVFRILTRTPEAYRPGPELSRFQWIKTADLPDLTMELWSTMALTLMQPPIDSGS